MIVEERIYTFHPGKVPAFMTDYETGPRELQSRILGRMLAYFTSEFGEQNQTVHLWAYENLADRAERRAEQVRRRRTCSSQGAADDPAPGKPDPDPGAVLADRQRKAMTRYPFAH